MNDDLDTIVGLLEVARRPLLLGLDIDGTLSPIVAHASEAHLVPGVLDSLQRLHRRNDMQVVLVTGRSVADARATFLLPTWLAVVGSHGREWPGDDSPTDKAADLVELGRLAEALVEGIDGAWVEHKPFSVVVHVRQADAAEGARILQAFDSAATRDGATVLHGSAVVEAGLGPLDKGAAINRWRAESGAAAVCFVGDDVTDERVFTRLGQGDVAVKVGTIDDVEASVAPWRLNDPERVATLLTTLAAGAGGGSRTLTPFGTGT